MFSRVESLISLEEIAIRSYNLYPVPRADITENNLGDITAANIRYRRVVMFYGGWDENSSTV